MNNVARAYFDKALNMQSQISRLNNLFLGTMFTLLSTFLILTSGHKYNGDIPTFTNDCIACCYNIDLSINGNALYVIFIIAIVYLGLYAYLFLKYREYSSKYTELTAIYFFEEYLENNNLKLENINCFFDIDWRQIIEYIEKKTLFQGKYLVKGLDRHFYRYFNKYIDEEIDKSTKAYNLCYKIYYKPIYRYIDEYVGRFINFRIENFIEKRIKENKTKHYLEFKIEINKLLKEQNK